MKDFATNLIHRIITYFLFYKRLSGFGTIIKTSSVANENVIIFQKCYIIKSILKQNVSVFDNSCLIDCILKGYNRIGSKCNISAAEIGKFTYVADLAKINNITIGKFCSIGVNLTVGFGSHPTNFISTSPLFYNPIGVGNITIAKRSFFEEHKRTNIANDVWIGANVSIIDGVNIGNGAIVGAGSVVTRDVPDYAIVGGVPAKIIKYRHSPEVIDELKKISWWDKDFNWIEKNAEYFQKPISDLSDINSFHK